MNQPVCMSGGKNVFFKDIIGKERMTTNMFFLMEQFWLLHIDTMLTTMGGHINILLLRTGLNEDTFMGSGLWVAGMPPRPSPGVVKNVITIMTSVCQVYKYLAPLNMGIQALLPDAYACG